jgi:hypothetical protein
MASRSVTTAKSSAMSGQTAGNHPDACGVGAVISTRSDQRRTTASQLRLAVTASSWTARSHIQQTTGAAATRRTRCGSEERRKPQENNGKGLQIQLHYPRSVLRGGATDQHRGASAASSKPDCRCSPGGTAPNKGPVSSEEPPTTNRSVSPGPECKQCVCGQYVQSRNCSPKGHDGAQ